MTSFSYRRIDAKYPLERLADAGISLQNLQTVADRPLAGRNDTAQESRVSVGLSRHCSFPTTDGRFTPTASAVTDTA
ncbi:hypothetical protein ASG25_20730 [Rhizobium sp. Leaf384]|nr:hypothetical protein ASG25_20730 [Rhizobium sp. Leaf384]